VAEFVSSATSGEAARFTNMFPDLTWVGAWREVFTRLVARSCRLFALDGSSTTKAVVLNLVST
jgi:hypothetical protein